MIRHTRKKKDTSIKKNTNIFNRIAKINILLFKKIIFLLFINLYISCIEPSIEEITRIKSPNNILDAVLLRYNYHATVPYVYRVYIVKRNKKIKDEENNMILLAQYLEQINIVWLNNYQLEIEYERARIYKFTNFLKYEIVKNNYSEVEILLKKIEKK